MYKHLPVNELYEDEFESIQRIVENSGIKLKGLGMINHFIQLWIY